MDKKEALQNIIYNLKEIESTRLRLTSAKPDALDIEMALLNQQILNIYQHLQTYRSGLYASQPSAPITKVETPAPSWQPPVEEAKILITQEIPIIPVREEPKAVVQGISKPEPVKIPEPVPIPSVRPVETIVPEPDTELKRENKDAALRKERLKRLEAEAAQMEAERLRQTAPQSAPQGRVEDFTQIVEDKYQEADIASDAAKASGMVHEAAVPPKQQRPETEVTLNEKLQSGTKLPGSLNDKFQQNDTKKTLAEKMKLGPISDLKSAMALNQKIAFTNGLFNGDDKEFKKALSFLGNCRNFSEAKIYLQTEIGKIHNWDENDPLVEEFTELVYRKFL